MVQLYISGTPSQKQGSTMASPWHHHGSTMAGRVEDAIVSYRQAQTLSPRSILVANNLGTALMQQVMLAT